MVKDILILSFVLVSISAFSQNIILQNGQVWNGTSFEQQSLFISNGRIVDYVPAKIDTLIEATGKFIIPPFGDYHTHVFDSDYAKATDSIYRSKGIFFAQDLANDPLGRKRNEVMLKGETSVDVSFANGCVTSNFGHPIEAYERMALGVYWPKNQEEREQIRNSRLYEGRTYHIIDDKEDVRPKMEALLFSQPNLIKVILWESEAYESGQPIPVDNLGLNPDILPKIVQIADEFGLPVIAHVHTEADLLNALDAGITRFAHIPYYSYGNDGSVTEDYPKFSEAALESISLVDKVVVNPTLCRTFPNVTYLPEKNQLTELGMEQLRAFHRNLLMDMKKAGVQIAAGADFPGLSAIDEVYYYDQLKVFEPLELLNMLINTSKLIFPDRKIGVLKNGYEANCLLLEKDPTADIKHIEDIVLRIKMGKILE